MSGSPKNSPSRWRSSTKLRRSVWWPALRYWHSWDKAATTADHVVLTGHLADRLLVPPDGLLTLYPLGPAPGAGVDFLVRRSVWNDVGGFEERFRGMYEDQAFLSKVFLRHKVFVAGRTWINYRQHAGSATAAASWSSRHYHASRAAFLSWLSSYLRQNQIAEPAVAARLRACRTSLRQTRMRYSVQRGRRWLRSVLPLLVSRLGPRLRPRAR